MFDKNIQQTFHQIQTLFVTDRRSNPLTQSFLFDRCAKCCVSTLYSCEQNITLFDSNLMVK